MPHEAIIALPRTTNLLTFSEAGRRLGLSRSLVRRAIAAGELETVTLAGRRWIKPASVIATAARLAAADVSAA